MIHCCSIADIVHATFLQLRPTSVGSMSIPVELLLQRGLNIQEPSQTINRAAYNSLHLPLENMLLIVQRQVTPKGW